MSRSIAAIPRATRRQRRTATGNGEQRRTTAGTIDNSGHGWTTTDNGGGDEGHGGDDDGRRRATTGNGCGDEGHGGDGGGRRPPVTCTGQAVVGRQGEDSGYISPRMASAKSNGRLIIRPILLLLHGQGRGRDSEWYGVGGLKPGSRQQFIIFNSIINLVQRRRRASLLAQCSTVYPVMNRCSPFRLGLWWCWGSWVVSETLVYYYYYYYVSFGETLV